MRCEWAKTPLEKYYHDMEWGVPIYEDDRLFECLSLEGAQAGLSWATILSKRENYRKTFDNFNIEKVACYTDKKVMQLIKDKGIVRNKLKIQSVINNAKAIVKIQQKYGSFSHFIWGFTKGKTLQNHWKNKEQIPSKTDISCKMSKTLKKECFKFVGDIICYSFMQAIGMVNDHTVMCDRYLELSQREIFEDKN